MIEAAKPTAQPTSASPPSQGAGESRFDPVTGNWTLFAPHRSERPDELWNPANAFATKSRARFVPVTRPKLHQRSGLATRKTTNLSLKSVNNQPNCRNSKLL